MSSRLHAVIIVYIPQNHPHHRTIPPVHKHYKTSPTHLVSIIVAAFLTGGGMTLFILAIIGSSTPFAFTGTTTALLPATRREVWTELTDLNALAQRRPEVIAVEPLDNTEDGRKRWKEHTKRGGSIIFSIAEEQPERRLAVRMEESTFGMTGTWTYELADAGASTALTIHEESFTTSVLLRALMTMSGRDTNLRREIDTLRSALQSGS